MASRLQQKIVSQQSGFRRFDYASCTFGIIATLLVVFSNITGPFLFIVEAFAAVICLLFLSMLAGSLLLHFLNRSEMRIGFCHVACNLLPTLVLYLVSEKHHGISSRDKTGDQMTTLQQGRLADLVAEPDLLGFILI